MNQMTRVCLLIAFCMSYASITPLFAQIENADALPKQFDVIGGIDYLLDT